VPLTPIVSSMSSVTSAAREPALAEQRLGDGRTPPAPAVDDDLAVAVRSELREPVSERRVWDVHGAADVPGGELLGRVEPSRRPGTAG
jgi:hypothetical protein